MTTITKEWLQREITSIESARDDMPFGLDEEQSNTLAALKIALAALEAEPVGYYRNWCGEFYLSNRMQQRDGTVPLYTAPPTKVVGNGWISVIESMPPTGDIVALICPDLSDPVIGYLTDCNGFIWELEERSRQISVSHWMPLPSAPQQEAKQP